MSTDACRGGRCTAPETWTSAIEHIAQARTIAISGHTNPDGDALGSCLGLGLSLRGRYPEKDIVCLLADNAEVPRILRFLPGASEMIPAAHYDGIPDLFISVDVPILERLADSSAVARRARRALVIDHHPAREEFTDLVVRKTSAAAAAMLVAELIDTAGFPLDANIATCLLTGIVTDTGRFQYQNADVAAFACASRLLAAGADPARISLEVYQSQRLEYLRLESIVMGRIKTVSRGLVAYSYIHAMDLTECGVTSEECDGLVDIVRSVLGIEIALFLKEVEPGEIRGNLRSKGSLDISPVARALAGGGHAAAAGFTYRGSIEEALDEILPRLDELVRSVESPTLTEA
ncbi:bifunctional oligoribonuclease/PAP phosphatase NrnA [Collinsella sp. AGMB00827]|uniref:Bifunctional oligoribonuclease/PAP phosphatase NrnA n=1 Tax=Collinsella ureilytica TaxID=2869515 RepID=A0ABS7MKR2_9ACTN|nr:bifunctional oligoribonuclease/PAP phosphatase NrnA [Collinsella urealyticum]MBY4797949.1 bifunctional oligoribonuclease/PAP phosphatase NrnA [Collinsella urealyticum]